jgi:hypothetical protein
MPSLFYFAASTDSPCIEGCDHEHSTVASAVACISSAGGYVIACENARLRKLNDEEEKQYQSALYGIATGRRQSLLLGQVNWPNLLDGVLKRFSQSETEKVTICPLLYYFAACTDYGCVVGCDHEHSTVASAVACISNAGGYVIAVENGQLRKLNEEEEKQYQSTMYDTEPFRHQSRPLGWVGWPNLLDPDEV